MNEWGFAGEIKSWWDAEIHANPSLGLGDVRIEESPEGDAKRSDITVKDNAGHPLLVLELRLPDHPQPDPDDIANINNAMTKAQGFGARWSATTDGDRFRLLDHSHHDRPTRERSVPVASLAAPATRADLEVPAKRAAIKDAWAELLHRLAPVLTGRETTTVVPADEFFVDSLRASLTAPFVATRDAISARKDHDVPFRANLIRWMVDEQGWPHDAAQFEDEIAHVAQVATYVFATRLLFYDALRRARPELPALELPVSGNASTARAVIKGLFENAQAVTGDYATVFAYDDVTLWALISDDSCLRWRVVVELLDHFELDKISFDVLGRLFERLIDPHERYQWGQHYTAPDVVDFMLSAALPGGHGKVADPASGGGTFLVRAYTRKKAYDPAMSHEQRLAEIAGGDISAFAASVSTISLASQHLDLGANYPQVRVGSFFAARPDKVFMHLPDTDGNPTERYVADLDAVVCNPPYIKNGDIGTTRTAEVRDAIARDWPGFKLAHKWNYHLPFWLHAAAFVKDDGRIAFITSGEWYDSDYGVQLQDWLLTRFHIELVVESMAEQWFGEARVGTVVLVARKLALGTPLTGLDTRFVTLRKPLRVLFDADTSDDTVRLLAVDGFRDRLLALTGHGEGDDFDHHAIAQTALRERGTVNLKYVGTPWRSMYLRSPHLAHTYAARDDFAPVGELATIGLGAKTGADDFFFVKRTSGGARVTVRGYKGWSGVLNRDVLRPALRRPGDLDLPGGGRRFVVPQTTTWYYLSPTGRNRPTGPLGAYIAHGEATSVHEREAVRPTGDRPWYRQDAQLEAGDWVLPYNSAYDYFAVDNTAVHAVLNGRLVGATARAGLDTDLLGAVLNSTFMLMSRLMVGVQTGNEGAYDVGPPALRTARVPDPRRFAADGADRVRSALQGIRQANLVPPAPDEHGAVSPLRRNLDSAILQALGYTPGRAAVALDELYAAYARWRTAVRVVEVQVQDNRRRLAARGGDRTEDPTIRAARTILADVRAAHAPDLSALAGTALEWIDAPAPAPDHQDALLPRTVVHVKDVGPVDLGSADKVAALTELRALGVDGPVPLPADHTASAALAHSLHKAREELRADARARAALLVGEDHADTVAAAVDAQWRAEQVTAVRNATGTLAVASEAPSMLHPEGLVPPAE